MIHIKRIGIVIGILLLLIINVQCASGKQEDIKFPFGIKDAYFQQAAPGVKGKDSGFVVYIKIDPLSDRSYEYIFFKGKKVKLEPEKTNTVLLIGRYPDPFKKPDLIMSDDPKEELKNQIPEIQEKIPFELKDNECVITYTRKGEQDFVKLDNLTEK